MKTPQPLLRGFGLSTLTILLLTATSQAANFTTAATQGSGQNWNATIWAPGSVAPSAGNTYECVANGTAFGNSTANTRIRNPATAGVQTFVGDSLTLNTNTEIRAKQSGAILDFPGVGGNPGLILNGGVLNAGDDTVFTVTGKVAVVSPSFIVPGDNGAGTNKPLRGFKFASALSGSGDLIIGQAGVQVAQEVSSADNTYSGNWIVHSGWLKGSGNNSLGTGNLLIVPTNSALMPAKLEINYDLVSQKALTLTGGGQLVLHQHLTFSAVKVEGTLLETRDYAFDELNVSFPNNFPAGGSGLISIVPPPTLPAPASVTKLNRDSAVDLQWATVTPATSYDAVSYNVKRADAPGGPYAVIAAALTTNFFADATLVNGLKYYYVISTSNGGGEGPDSAEVVGEPNNLVTGFAAVGAGKDVQLNWDAFGGATGYTLKRGTVSGAYTVTNSGIEGTSYTDTTTVNGAKYFYVIFADLPGGGQSGISAEVSAVTIPSTPALTLTMVCSTVAKLAWSTPDPTLTQFVLEQSDDGQTFNPILTVPSSARASLVPGLSWSATYSFRVKAVNGAGESGYATAGPLTMPDFGIHVNFANASFKTNFPGYVNDYSLVYGDRANGYFYGWDLDNSANARERNNAASPDKRYDTFTHLQKTTPGRTWEIAIPNGFYYVHIGSGDATANDSVFQDNVEGSLTGSYTPTATARFGEVYTTCLVDDGRLTVTSGPLAANNKIDYIDIYRAIPVPIAIDQQPQSQQGIENHTFSLSVTVTNAPIPTGGFYGALPIRYTWFKDNAPVAGGTSATLTFLYPQTTDAGNYFVVASNYAGAVTSQVATVTVAEDVKPPAIVSVGSLDGITFGVVFSETMETNTFAFNVDPGNYTVVDAAGNGYTVTQVTLRSNLASALLVVDASAGAVPAGPFTLTAGMLADRARNLGYDISGSGLVRGYTSQDLGTLGTDPRDPSVIFVPDANQIEITADGHDIWDAADGMNFAYKQYAGDFDARVRIASLFRSDTWTKAGLMVREALSAGSRDLAVVATPAVADGGQGQFQTLTRATTGAGAAELGDPTNRPPLFAYPNNWVRLQRQGAEFITSVSADGETWTPHVTNTPATPFPDTVYVGLATTSHNTNATSAIRRTLAVYRDLTITHVAPQAVSLTQWAYANGQFGLSCDTVAGFTYVLQYKDSLADDDWTDLQTINGDGTTQILKDTSPAVPMRFYRMSIR